MTAKTKKEKKSILLENTFLPFGVEMLFSWFTIAPYYGTFKSAYLKLLVSAINTSTA